MKMLAEEQCRASKSCIVTDQAVLGLMTNFCHHSLSPVEYGKTVLYPLKYFSQLCSRIWSIVVPRGVLATFSTSHASGELGHNSWFVGIPH